MGINITLEDIQPFVRYMQLLTVTKEMPFLNMNAYDNRMFYVIGGNGMIRVDGAVYPMTPGCLLIWRAGLPYEIIGGESALQMLGCNFDFTQAEKEKNAPVPPGKISSFRESVILDSCIITDFDPLNRVLYLENAWWAEDFLRQAFDEYAQQRLMTPTRLSALLILVLTGAVRASAPYGGAGKTEIRTAAILDYIRCHYSENLSNRSLGELFHYHPNYINQLIVTHTGVPLHRYLLRYRIQQAIHFLQNTDYPASRIAELTGFRDYNYFLKYFKKQTGYTTKQFRP